MSEQARMLTNIMQIEFAAVELNLYLDTHPTDRRALDDYNAVTRQLRDLKNQYQRVYGPLVNFGHSPSQAPWRWVEEPWPWEVEF
jgi:spore coat protein JB